MNDPKTDCLSYDDTIHSAFRLAGLFLRAIAITVTYFSAGAHTGTNSSASVANHHSDSHYRSYQKSRHWLSDVL